MIRHCVYGLVVVREFSELPFVFLELQLCRNTNPNPDSSDYNDTGSHRLFQDQLTVFMAGRRTCRMASWQLRTAVFINSPLFTCCFVLKSSYWCCSQNQPHWFGVWGTSSRARDYGRQVSHGGSESVDRYSGIIQ